MAVRALPPCIVNVLILIAGPVWAQTPTGTLDGVVADRSSAGIPGAHVTIVNPDTHESRTVETSSDGWYVAPALVPNLYQVTAEAAGFRRSERMVTVSAGETTRADFVLEIGDLADTVTVTGETSVLRYDSPQLGSVVRSEQIERLPLNGRNFLELVKLEPGVTSPVRGTNNRVFISALGAGLQAQPRVGYTRVTIDGANIDGLGGPGAILQVSQDVVQEFHISTVNFNQATSLTTNAAVNIVTKAGGNAHHGTGFDLYRDHNVAAYPGLQRDPNNPDPFFRRQQEGLSLGGPIRTDRAFFYASYERNDQRGVVSVQPATPEFAPLGGIFSSPYVGNQFSGRVDLRLHPNHTLFARFTHDGNRAFAPLNDATDRLPSSWTRTTNRVDQGMAALTSVLSPTVVNDLRISNLSLDSPEHPATADDCSGCFALGTPSVSIPDARIAFGDARTLGYSGHRAEVADHLTWQRQRHVFSFGFDWEHSASTNSTLTAEPVQMTLWSPAQVRQLDPTIRLPASFSTVDDVLQLPVQSFSIGVGSTDTFFRDFLPYRVLDLFRFSGSDVWRVTSRLTINYGLAWAYEPNALNHDLTKPALLVPLLGVDGLHAPAVEKGDFSPTAGFAWTATRDGKTVVRGGAGRYFDPAGSTNALDLASERLALSPAGTGRAVVSFSSITLDGREVNLQQRPSSFTGADLMASLPQRRGDLMGRLNPGNRDFSITNIDINKQGTNLFDPAYTTPSAVHVGLGVQRELGHGLAVSADVVLKQFTHTFIPSVDYNRWNSARGSVLPPCLPTQKGDVSAPCSTGPITFDTTSGRARYRGLLLRLDKRASSHVQLLASYAYGSYSGTNGTGGVGAGAVAGGTGFNNDNWLENDGPLPTDYRHVLNVSGSVDLPWRVQVAFSVSASSAPPFSAYVSGVDFNGDGTRNDLLPGSTVNQFGRALDKGDLERLVQQYNSLVAGTLTPTRQTAPPISLPADYSFNDSFFTQDVRLAKTLVASRGGMRMLVFGEVFNLLNTANLINYGNNIANVSTFGRPGARVSQVFGSGGPRAFQLGARVTY